MSSPPVVKKYCVTKDGDAVSKMYPPGTACPVPAPGDPMPWTYLVGPATSGSVFCATTEANGNQVFTQGACAAPSPSATQFEFYGYPEGYTTLCFQKKTDTAFSITDSTATCTDPGSFQAVFDTQPVTCVDTGCGNHGACPPNSNTCQCQPGWSGARCDVSPSGTPCRQDSDCGAGGKCSSVSGKCTCPPDQYGQFCELSCNTDQDCGGSNRGLCVGTDYLIYTNRNAVMNTCQCSNGWSGANCQNPPSNWTCSVNGDCTDGSVDENGKPTVTGTCQAEHCDCYPGYTGAACQTSLGYIPCTINSDCDGKGGGASGSGTCTNGKCTDGGLPIPSDSSLQQILNAIGNILSRPDLLVSFMIVGGLVKKGVSAYANFIIEKLAAGGGELATAVTKKLIAAGLGNLVSTATKESLVEELGIETTTKLLAKESLSSFLDRSIESATGEVVKLVISQVFGTGLSVIFSIEHMLGMLGMALDVLDVAGLREDLTNDQVTAIMQKMTLSINSNPNILKMGLTFPLPLQAEDTFQFKLESTSKSITEKSLADAKDYLSHLTNNSDGNRIIPNFTPKSQADASAAQAALSNNVLYLMAGKNMDVYNRLNKNWPFVLVAVIAVVGIIVGAVLGARRMARKK